jgi:hypothetical protein
MTSLRQRMTEDMQVRNLALNTQTSYLQQVSLFAVMDPVFWTGSLSGKAALTMKENQCHELARTTPQA